jgi:hypothetical protein
MSQEPHSFGATLSKGDRIITYLVGCGIILAPLVASVSLLVRFQDKRFLLLSMVSLLLVWYLMRWRIQQFSATREAIAIERGVGEATILFTDIQKISRLTAWPRGMTLRLFGIGGFYGSQGIFWNKTFGKFYLYLTDSRHMIEILEKNGQRTIISPDTPEEFLRTVAKIRIEGGFDFEIIK